MNRRNKFWIFVIISLAVTLAFGTFLIISFWNQLDPREKIIFSTILSNHFAYVLGVVVVVVGGFIFILDGIFHLYIQPIKKLTEEMTLIHTVNPSHRIKTEGGKWFIDLARIVNDGAERLEEKERITEKQIQNAKAEMEEERNMFAAILSELPQGVMICNADWQIILYDKQVRQFFEKENGDPSHVSQIQSSRFIGLGRSVFGVIDKDLIVHAIDEIAEKLNRHESDLSSSFMLVGKKENLLRVEARPILGHQNTLTGFFLIMEDITRQMEEFHETESMIRELTIGIRAKLAGIRSAIETIMDYRSKMDADQVNRFRQIIHTESIAIGDLINSSTKNFTARKNRGVPLIFMQAKDLMKSLQHRLRGSQGINLKLRDCDEEGWIRAETYSMLLALGFLFSRLKKTVNAADFFCDIFRKNEFVMIDIGWIGEPLSPEVIRKWNDEIISIDNRSIPISLNKLLTRHDVELFPYTTGTASGESCLRILFPFPGGVQTGTVQPRPMIIGSRPEFYDFDLFEQIQSSLELEDRLLTDLTYTVFDTETTGLNPREGDEIISIGAVRIVNGKLLKEEFFDRLVDPGRSIPKESIRVHGILPEMLKGQPVINEVLPVFQEFAKETVLVAHNAAFDMQMLKEKEKDTGVKFTNPVIDTLLLSAVVHSSHQSHDLEMIAKRMGVALVGRHTALGDAIATAEIYLKLIPLLEKLGIRTLKEAWNASRKTFYARKRY
ncbi:MAG: 3'-5' exonuclease [Thermodesulfobacteriota bacterium]